MYKITDECISCGACADECPEEAISENDELDRFEIDQSKCTQCGTCIDTCPTEAIIIIDD